MQGYKPPNAQASEYQTIPMNKIEDFGVHANQYYPLDVSFFKSSLDSHMLDMLWNKCAPPWRMHYSCQPACAIHPVSCFECFCTRTASCSCAPALDRLAELMCKYALCRYWVNTLAASPLINTRELTSGQISDIGEHQVDLAWCMPKACCTEPSLTCFCSILCACHICCFIITALARHSSTLMHIF